MRPTPYVASLRVYEPLEAFGEIDQLRWSEISMDQHTGRQEQNLALRRIIRPEQTLSRIDGAHIIEHEGSVMLLPGQQRFAPGRRFRLLRNRSHQLSRHIFYPRELKVRLSRMLKLQTLALTKHLIS